MNSRNIQRRNLFLLGLLAAGSFLFLVLYFFASYYHAHPANPAFYLRINEVCITNPGTSDGEELIYRDYVELYNPSNQEVPLEHIFLSDSTKDFSLGPLPADIIAPGGYYVIYTDDSNGFPFLLS